MRGVFAPSHAETSAFGSRASPSDRSKRSSSERRWEWRARQVPEPTALTGGRVRRAARGAAQKMRGARVVLFLQQKRPFLPTQHGKGREGDEDGGGLDVEATETRVVSKSDEVFWATDN